MLKLATLNLILYVTINVYICCQNIIPKKRYTQTNIRAAHSENLSNIVQFYHALINDIRRLPTKICCRKILYQKGKAMFKTVLFDVDGTIIDTEYVMTRSLQKTLLEEKQLEVSLEELHYILGIPG
jgi:hypothetical protein